MNEPRRAPAYPLTHETVADLFRLHKPHPEDAIHFDATNEAVMILAHAIVDHVPAGPGQTIALRKLAETRMAINSAIIFEGAW